MRLFIIILIGVLLLLQHPEIRKYADGYLNKVEAYRKKLMEIETIPPDNKTSGTSNTSAASSSYRRVNAPIDLPRQDNSPSTFGTNYRGERAPFSGSRGGY